MPENIKRKTKEEVLAWVAEMLGETLKQELQGLRNQAQELLAEKTKAITEGLSPVAIEAKIAAKEKQIEAKVVEIEATIKSNRGKRLVIADEGTPSASLSHIKKEVEVL